MKRLALLICWVVAAQAADDLLFFREGWLVQRSPAGVRRLAAATRCSRSPDRRRAACADGKQLLIVDLANGSAAPLSGLADEPGNPAWSPRQDWIAYESGSQIHLVRSNGTGRRSLDVRMTLGKSHMLFGLAWHPDGASLLVHDLERLYRFDLNGNAVSATPLSHITGEPFRVSSADWFLPSPSDPELLAFTRAVRGTALFERRYHEPNTGLFVYDGRTRRARRLTPEDLLAIDPAWSPDGAFIYFSGYRDRDQESDPFRIYRLRPDGSGLSEVARGERPCP